MKHTSAMVSVKCMYSSVLMCVRLFGSRMVPFSDCRKIKPSRHMLRKKHENVPNNHVIAVFPAAHRASRPWCARSYTNKITVHLRSRE